ncbi:MAG TPA: efflux RND transporter periplasmic adaptor subunit [Steroidobacteraceae bacterium]|nr:efflux RND transporter periplasmic adaptor subunit [Steroidobacteraceae bacterium]
MRFHPLVRSLAAATLVLCVCALQGCGREATSKAAAGSAPPGSPAVSATASQSVDLSSSQLQFVSVAPAGERLFTVQREAVGVVDYDEDLAVQVSSPYAGRIVELRARTGDRVRRGQELFSIASPDLVQAESTLIGSAATLALDDQALKRANGLYAVRGMAQKDYEQAVSDQQTAQGAYEAARDAVRIFGLSDADIDRIVAQRRVAASLPVRSPIDGVVTARNAAPGALVQPGSTPTPYTVADVRTKWLLAQVPEDLVPLLRLGQAVDVRLPALPTWVFHGRISNIGEALDPNTRRVAVRSDVSDPDNELHPQMFATFTLHLGDARRSVAVPYDAVVREGDGTMTVWVTADRHHFVRRTVQLGEQQGGYDQILGGLRSGELVATTGALFISNAAVIGAAE